MESYQTAVAKTQGARTPAGGRTRSPQRSSLACPQLPPDHLRPGSLAPNIGDHGPSDSALTAASGWRLRRPAADWHAARCASRDLCSGARPSAPCALAGGVDSVTGDGKARVARRMATDVT